MDNSLLKSVVLKSTLSGLDINLDQELERYRNWQLDGKAKTNGRSDQSVILRSPTAIANYDHLQTSTLNSLNKDQDLNRDPDLSNLIDDLSNDLLLNFNELEEEFQTDIYSNSLTAKQNIKQNIEPTKPLDQNQELEKPDMPLSNESEALGNLLSPLGIVSVILLLISSAVIGYLLVDPSGLTRLMKLNSDPKKQSSNQTAIKNLAAQNLIQFPFVSTSTKKSEPLVILAIPQIPTPLNLPQSFPVPQNSKTVVSDDRPIRVLSKVQPTQDPQPNMIKSVNSKPMPIILPSRSPVNPTITEVSQTRATQIPKPNSAPKLPTQSLENTVVNNPIEIKVQENSPNPEPTVNQANEVNN